MSDTHKSALAEITSEVVAAYVAQNHIQAAELPKLIASVHEAFTNLGKPPEMAKAAVPLVPAVPVKKSVTDDYIISLEDGRKLKSMKRYLATLSMTPAEYRAKWGLPRDYPMVAPAYAAKRSELAKSLGLGRKGGQDMAEAMPEAEPEATETPAAEVDGVKKPRKRAAKAA
jgi:predicted transcriptional regulator